MTGIALADRMRIAALLAAQALRGLLARLYVSPLYRWRFSGSAPERLTVAPQDIRTADPTIAGEIYSGRYSLAGAVAETGGSSPFEMDPPSPEWQEALHGFGWLRHLRAADSELARIHARALIDDWMVDYGRWHPMAWEPEVVARRIISWLSHSPLVLQGADHAFYRRFLRSLSRQSRYLNRTAVDTREGMPRLLSAAALTYCGLCMAGRGRLARHSTRWLEEELDRQILPDGGHVGRNPNTIVELLLDLLPLRQTFSACDVPPPQALISALDRMMPMLRFFRHGDGALAHFNGMGPTRSDLLATLLAYDDTRGVPVHNAPHSGYQRLEAGDSVLVVDTGRAPPPLLSAEAHAGCLSFEFSSLGERIVVNCGAPAFGSPAWRAVARSTAAHSTATVEDTSSCHFASAPWVLRRLGAVVMSGPRAVPVERHDEPLASLASSHDGYAANFGLVHERRLALAPDGGRLDGEDVFRFASGREGADLAFAVRFHLHPRLRASMTRDGTRAVIETGRGQAWELVCEGAAPTVEESVYLGGIDGPRRCDQVVLYGRCRLSPRVAWSLRRIAATRQRGPGRRPDTGGEEELPLAPEEDDTGA